MSVGVGRVVSSECSECGVLVHWKVVEIDASHSEWEPLDAESGFVCEHWRDHQEAHGRALMNKSGRAYVWPVKAKVLTRRAVAVG
jgi:hypothetical protein